MTPLSADDGYTSTPADDRDFRLSSMDQNRNPASRQRTRRCDGFPTTENNPGRFAAIELSTNLGMASNPGATLSLKPSG